VSFLRSEVKGKLLLALVEFTDILTILLVRDSEDAGDRLAHGVAAGEISMQVSSRTVECARSRQHRSGTTGNLLHV
jgi:hypothetical protein